LLEDHVAEEKGGGDDLPDGGHVLLVDAHHPHGLKGVLELLAIVLAGDADAAVAQEGVVLRVFQDEFFWKEKDTIVDSF